MFKNLYFIPEISKEILLIFNYLDLRFINLIFIFIIFFISTFIDLIGISILYPYISVILNSDTKIDNLFFHYFTLNFINFENESNRIYIIGLILLFVFVFKFFIALLINFLINNFSFNQIIKLRFKLAKKYSNMNYENFINRNTSEYINILNNVAGDLNTIIISLLRVLNDLILIICFVIFLLFFNIYITCILLIIFLSIFVLYNIFLKPRLMSFGKIININSNLFIKKISELISGYREISILSKQDYFVNRIDNHSKIVSNYRVKFSVINAMPRYFVELVLVVLIIFLISFYTYTNLISPEELLSIIAVFSLVAIRMFPSITSLLSNVSRMDYVKNSIEVLLKELKIHENFKETKTPNSKFEFKEISFENVSFGYKNSNIIKNINFLIKKNDIVGIKGASGKGKTTLINLIIGFLRPKSGYIYINGNKNANFIKHFSNCIAYLPQEIFTIDGSIAQNVALTEDTKNLEDKINKALKKAKLNDYIDELENNINTNIGDKGIKVSGGQKQRIGIARSFYFDKEILIFDEATSALDKITEKEILNEIFELKGKVTIIIISHNLDLYSICNQVIDLDNK